jgi:uncharacterized protein YqgC (DUF456 family)
MLLQVSLVLLAVPPALLIVLGFVIYEVRSTSLQSEKKKVTIHLIFIVLLILQINELEQPSLLSKTAQVPDLPMSGTT